MFKDRISPHVADALRQINDWQKATSEPSLAVEPGSSLSGDDAKVPTLRVSSAAYQCFAHAVDHLHAVQALLFEAKVIHSY
ncbi:hypothetical protein [Streptomyces sp. NPDC088812]|uniref:hypothetical protein n=1 Tax=Streptomyces sp. NPDC088812 TaxID=3365905 RepID=UPI0037F94B0E